MRFAASMISLFTEQLAWTRMKGCRGPMMSLLAIFWSLVCTVIAAIFCGQYKSHSVTRPTPSSMKG